MCSFPPFSRWYARWWRLSCTSSSSPLSAGCWPRPGSPTWPWRVGYGTASSASASCVSDGVRIVGLHRSSIGPGERKKNKKQTTLFHPSVKIKEYSGLVLCKKLSLTPLGVSKRAQMVENEQKPKAAISTQQQYEGDELGRGCVFIPRAQWGWGVSPGSGFLPCFSFIFLSLSPSMCDPGISKLWNAVSMAAGPFIDK